MSGELLSAADITFTNLESPLSDQGTKLDGKGIWFRGSRKIPRPYCRQVLML
jgi:hypothetical protein